MARLLRPYIPTDIRLRVVLRQLGDLDPEGVIASARRQGMMIATLASLLCLLADRIGTTPERLHLDHDPALQNRRKIIRLGLHIGYDPPANDPAHLVYRELDDHRIKTLVHGDGALLSDAAQARKNKKISRRIAGKKKRGPKLRSANRWPPKGSRKINWRKGQK